MKEKQSKRKFSEEFKDEAVELAKREGNSKAAKDLGVSESCIRYWRKKLEPSTGEITQTGSKASKKFNFATKVSGWAEEEKF